MTKGGITEESKVVMLIDGDGFNEVGKLYCSLRLGPDAVPGVPGSFLGEISGDSVVGAAEEARTLNRLRMFSLDPE